MPCNTRFQSETKHYPDLFVVSFGPFRQGCVIYLNQGMAAFFQIVVNPLIINHSAIQRCTIRGREQCL